MNAPKTIPQRACYYAWALQTIHYPEEVIVPLQELKNQYIEFISDMEHAISNGSPLHGVLQAVLGCIHHSIVAEFSPQICKRTLYDIASVDGILFTTVKENDASMSVIAHCWRSIVAAYEILSYVSDGKVFVSMLGQLFDSSRHWGLTNGCKLVLKGYLQRHPGTDLSCVLDFTREIDMVRLDGKYQGSVACFISVLAESNTHREGREKE